MLNSVFLHMRSESIGGLVLFQTTLNSENIFKLVVQFY